MTPQEAIEALKFDNAMMLFEPMTGEVKSYEQLNEDNRRCYDANIMAIAALEKQMPKKVVAKSKGLCCPNCNEQVFPFDDEEYCGRCSQALDWSESDED